jgi:hypothetical protein
VVQFRYLGFQIRVCGRCAVVGLADGLAHFRTVGQGLLLFEYFHGQLLAAPTVMYLSPVLGIHASADSVNLIKAVALAGLDNIVFVKAKDGVNVIE